MLLVAACASCDGRDTCTANGDCDTGEVCAGPEQGPFQCFKDCKHSSCAGDTTCTDLVAADCLGCGFTMMACFPNTKLHGP